MFGKKTIKALNAALDLSSKRVAELKEINYELKKENEKLKEEHEVFWGFIISNAKTFSESTLETSVFDGSENV